MKQDAVTIRCHVCGDEVNLTFLRAEDAATLKRKTPILITVNTFCMTPPDESPTRCVCLAPRRS